MCEGRGNVWGRARLSLHHGITYCPLFRPFLFFFFFFFYILLLIQYSYSTSKMFHPRDSHVVVYPN